MKKIYYILGILVLILLIFGIVTSINSRKTIQTTSNDITSLSNKKIGWGIKRNDNHEQPDLGTTNKKLLEENGGIAIGNSTDKFIYLTFDEGYEAGYTAQILKILKENNVKVTFFITAHYLNTAQDLVKQMIDEGHIVGNHIPHNMKYHI